MKKETIDVCIAEKRRRWIEKTESPETLRIDEILPEFRVPSSEMRRFVKESRICDPMELFSAEWKEAVEKLFRDLKKEFPGEKWSN